MAKKKPPVHVSIPGVAFQACGAPIATGSARNYDWGKASCPGCLREKKARGIK
jgi:hypothetical protein